MNFDTVLLFLIFILFAITVFFMVPTFQFTKKMYDDYPAISRLIFGSVSTVKGELSIIKKAAKNINMIYDPMNTMITNVCKDGIVTNIKIPFSDEFIKFPVNCNK